MRKLTFPKESYTDRNGTFVYNDGIVGIFELLWTGIQKSKLALSKNDHRVVRNLKRRLKVASLPKDKDNDSRIFNNEYSYIRLEDAEYEMLVKLFDNNDPWIAAISETVADVYDILETAEIEEINPIKNVQIVREDEVRE